MREKIYEVYKSLADFHVSPKEIDEIAYAYKRWLNCPKGAGLNYGNVYYHNGMLCSIPYYPVIDDLHYKLVGIEINGLIYLNGYKMNINRDSIAESLSQIKNGIFTERVCSDSVPEFKIEIPTLTEVSTLIKKTRYNFNQDMMLCSVYGKYWIRSNSESKIMLAEIKQMQSQTLAAFSQSSAIVVPVVHPQTNTFFGCIDEYGIPSAETTELYKDLCEFALKS